MANADLFKADLLKHMSVDSTPQSKGRRNTVLIGEKIASHKQAQ